MINGIRVLEKEPQKPMVGTNSRENKTYINSDIDMSELPVDVVELIQKMLAAQRK